jgi:hypothetical protein
MSQRSLILSRPDSSSQLSLYAIERTYDVIKRHFGFSAPDEVDVADAAYETLVDIGHEYGGQYVALLEVEADGQAYLPLHARDQRIHSVASGPISSTLLNGAELGEPWYPGLGIIGRQWVADQYQGLSTWRLETLEALTQFPQFRDNALTYQRTELGVYVPQLRRGAYQDVRPTVIVVYDARLVDDRNYVLISDADTTAVAYYWNYLRVQVAANQGVQGAANLLPGAEAMMNTMIARARTSEGLSESDMSYILSQRASWDRATYRHGFDAPTGQSYRRNNQHPPMFAADANDY